jgi:nitrate/nitrite transporter NarK
VRVGMLGAVPYVVAFVAMLFNGWHSDRSRERRRHAAVPLFVSAAGLLCLISLPTSTLMTVFLFSMICVFMAFLPAFWAIPTEILSESTAAVAVGMINALASVAGFAGPYAFGYLHSRTGSLLAGFAVLMVSVLAAAILMLLMPAAHSHPSKLVASAKQARA